MSDIILLTVSGLVIAATNAIEGITGFGSTVLALPFLNLTMGLKNSVILLCIFGWMMPVYIIYRSWKDISWKEFFKILIWCAPGVPVGMVLFGSCSPQILCILLGTFMVYTGISGCKGMKSGTPPPPEEKSLKAFLLKLALFMGGVIQGAFGTGGPFVVIYATRVLQNKTLFRVTLSMLWLTINSARLLTWIINGALNDLQMWKTAAYIFPLWLGGLFAGDHLHRKVSEYHFKRGVYILLAVAGAVMLMNNIINLTAGNGK